MSSIFSWRLALEERDRQLREYHTLGLSKSYRGISAFLIVGSAVVTVLLAGLQVAGLDLIAGLITAVIYVPVAYFVSKGHIWALALMIVLWTAEKGWQMYDMVEAQRPGGTQPMLAGPIVWWFLFMRYFVNAFRIELWRRQALASADPGGR